MEGIKRILNFCDIFSFYLHDDVLRLKINVQNYIKISLMDPKIQVLKNHMVVLCMSEPYTSLFIIHKV